MITTLTPEQTIAFKDFRARCFAEGSATGRADRPRAERAIAGMYAEIGEAAPRFMWFDSPATACLGRHVLMLPEFQKAGAAALDDRGSLRSSLGSSLESSLESSLGSSLWSSLRSSLGSSLESSLRSSLGSSLGSSLEGSMGGADWIYWVAFYEFCASIGVKYEAQSTKRLAFWSDVVRSIGWWFPFKGWCLACEHPAEIHWERRPAQPERLHREDGPALLFRDGWAIHSWRGVRVSRELIETPDKIDVRAVLKSANQEIRRATCERLGWERILATVGSREVQRDDYGTLLEIDTLGDGDLKARFVDVRCPSTERRYLLRVDPQTQTARAGVAATFGLDETAYAPEVQT